MQDGEKRPMLCHDCEERFSAFESKFATLFLDPYLESEKLKNLHWSDPEKLDKYF